MSGDCTLDADAFGVVWGLSGVSSIGGFETPGSCLVGGDSVKEVSEVPVR